MQILYPCTSTPLPKFGHGVRELVSSSPKSLLFLRSVVRRIFRFPGFFLGIWVRAVLFLFRSLFRFFDLGGWVVLIGLLIGFLPCIRIAAFFEIGFLIGETCVFLGIFLRFCVRVFLLLFRSLFRFFHHWRWIVLIGLFIGILSFA